MYVAHTFHHIDTCTVKEVYHMYVCTGECESYTYAGGRRKIGISQLEIPRFISEDRVQPFH